MVPALDRIHGLVHGDGDLFEGHVVAVVQDEDHAMVGMQGLGRLLELARELCMLEDRRRQRLRILKRVGEGYVVGLVVEFREDGGLSLFQVIERGVAGDGVEPGLEAQALFEALEVLPGLQERVLRDILGVLAVLGILKREAVDGVEVAVHELPKRAFLAVPGCFQELFIGHIVLCYHQPMAESNKKTLKDIRTERNITQEDLAKAVDVSRQTIISIEKGKYTPSVSLAIKIAKYFKVSVEELFS